MLVVFQCSCVVFQFLNHKNNMWPKIRRSQNIHIDLKWSCRPANGLCVLVFRLLYWMQTNISTLQFVWNFFNVHVLLYMYHWWIHAWNQNCKDSKIYWMTSISCRNTCHIEPCKIGFCVKVMHLAYAWHLNITKKKSRRFLAKHKWFISIAVWWCLNRVIILPVQSQ